jgi:hypothetical protein
MDAQLPGRRTAHAVFGFLVVLEALTAIPLGVVLPFSRAALACTAAILVALDLALFANTDRGPWRPALQVSIILVSGGALVLAIGSRRPSWQVSVAGIIGLYSCLSAIGLAKLSDGMLRRSFAAQQLALASTLVFWVLIGHFRHALDPAHATPFGHLGMGLRFVFIGPLALVPVVFLAGLGGWSGYLTMLAGVCVGQWGMGFIELGFALQTYALVIGGLVLGVGFGVLMVRALWLGLHPAAESMPFR